MQSDALVFGVDVAKVELVVACYGHRSVRHVPNERVAIQAWLQELPASSVVAMESSGSYHQLLASLAATAGLTVYVLNASDVYCYSRALGTRGKTDRVDARLIASYVAEHRVHLRPWRPAAASHVEVDALLRRRAVLAAKRDAVRQALAGLKDLRAEASQLDQAFQVMLRSIEAKVEALIAQDSQLAAAQARLKQVTGFGPVGSALLAVLLSRISFASADALVAYCGLDPRPRDSGQKHGLRRISKRGPAYLRRQWYLAGFSASHSKALKPLYQSIRAKGFAPTEAFLILGRKLLRVAYAVWKTGAPFDAGRLKPAPAG